MSADENVSRIIMEDDAVKLAEELYGVKVSAKRLPGYTDINFHLRDDMQNQYVLKISDISEEKEILEFQNMALKRLAEDTEGVLCPKVIGTVDGKLLESVECGDKKSRFARLLTYIPGKLLFQQEDQQPYLMRDVGRFMGTIDKALLDFNHPAMHREFLWDLRRASVMRQYLSYLDTWEEKSLADHFLSIYETLALPRICQLSTSVIHNDGNDYNLIVSETDGGAIKITGIIDFSDMLHTCTVFEPAIAAAYSAMGKDDPLQTAVQVTKGYNDIVPLEEIEVELLFPLICARLCSTVCQSAYLQTLDPENSYLAVSQKPAWEVLRKFAAIDPQDAHDLFRDACNIPPARDVKPMLGKEEILRLRKDHIGRSLSISYEKPLKIVRGFMQRLYDETGKSYLDAVNNVSHVGHCHPKVVRAAHQQACALNTNTRYLHDNLVQYASKLCSTMPDPLNVCFLVNSGSEANDLALRLARAYTGGEDLIVVDGAYHGNLSSLIDISPYKYDGPGGAGNPSYVHKTPRPDGYRGPFKYVDSDAGKKYAAIVGEVIKGVQADGRRISAFICESMLGCGGQIVLPQGYLKEVHNYVKEAGSVYIADEVQVGFGRVGEFFWAFQTQDVVPDIVTLGKPMGNGHPMAAVVTTPKIAASLNKGMEYFNTYGGNPVSCAVGMAVLNVIEEEKLQENALKTGAHLKAGLESLVKKHSLFGDVRGLGLFIGVELVTDNETLAPAASLAADIIEKMKDNGVLLSTDGPLHNVIKIKPPLVFNESDADFLLTTLDRVLDEVADLS